MATVTVWLRNRTSGVLSAPVTLTYDVGMTHGQQLTRSNIGPTGPLQPSGPIVTTQDDQVFENLDITGFLDVRHNVTLRNCQIVGDLGQGNAAYTIKHQRNLGRKLTLHNCRVITRSPNTKGLVSWGNGQTDAADSLFLGGTDNVYLKPGTAPASGFAHTFTRCFFGDVQRTPGSHSDCFQIDGGAGGVLLDRCSINSFSLATGEDPTTAQASVNSRASGGLILTYPSGAPEQIDRVQVVNCYFDGGNYTLDTVPPDGPVPTEVVLAGNTFGLHHTYGPIRTGQGQVTRDNTWAVSGVTTTGRAVIAGQPVE
ncbi:hypothetical protein BDK92_1098 [Micromonospora pisi]|uniref:Parallel beta helix pectate lyase-like protein n=1 Tax=Micromonospora pisi TaxID=589240 RepID=A0A495JCU2_9ACTN|nr:hypothetical protein [Micromonospora pisi]RKR86830.1 hypothetical protein BDK92_1098 [Micromonospora pisi]